VYGTVLSSTAPNGSGPNAAKKLPLTRGRRVALAIGVPLCAVLIGYIGLSILANIGTGSIPVSYTVPAGARTLAVNVDGGDVTVRPATTGQGTVTGVVHYGLVRPRITESRSAAAAFAMHCANLAGVSNCGLNLTASVPGRMPVSVSTGGGNLTANGITGDVSLSTSGGDVTASGVAGPLTISSGGGNVQATDVTAAEVSARTSGGDVEIIFTAVPRNVHVDTGGGNITIVVPHTNTQYHVTATSGGGNVSYPILVDSSSPYVITASTSGGDISIQEAS
jgi:hypothetical protein